MSVSRELVAKLYVATFNRAPDKAGLDYWVNNSGLAIEQIAQSFFDQAETQATYPAGTTNTAFVTAIYNNLFDRAPDAAGLAYWVGELDAGHLTKDVMILAVINGALGADATILENKADVGIYYADALNLEGADFSLAGVTADASSVVDAMKAAGDLVNNNEIDPAAFNGYSAVYTLQKVVGSTTTTVEGSGTTETYWGNGDCENCAMTIDEFYEMVETVTGLDLAMLGLANINADDPINDVQLIVNDNPDATNCCGSLVVTTSAGEQFTSELAIAQEYIAFLDSLIYYTDENGNKISRFTTKTTTETSEVTTYDITPIVLTPTVNNGTTFETGFTTAGNDLIVAGQTELLHGAYIDAGSGSVNTLEVDMKGGYAQPIQLLNIQEIHVQNLPNVYNNYYDLPDDANADGTDIPDYVGSSASEDQPNSILDLSRANSLGKLIINEGPAYPDVNGSGEAVLGSLTVVGVRNDAILRLEGNFSEDVTVQYGQGLDGTLDIELALGDVTADINLLQNAAVLNIHSDGVENHMHQFFAGGSISRMYITGPAAFGVDEDLSDSFNSGRPAIIDARQNDGGIDVTLNDHYNVKVYGTTDADDEITAQDSGQVMINAYNGSNVIDVDGSEYVSITTGTGNDSISAEDGIEVSITAGDGKNIITTDGSAMVEITSGSGNDVINANDGVNVTIDAGAGNNVINANGAVFGDTFGTAVVSITTGNGNDTISAVRNDVVTIDAGNGTNKITVSAFEINITTGTGSDTVTISGMDTEFVNGDDEGNWNDDNYEVGVSDSSTPGALLNLDLGSGTNTIVLGRDVVIGQSTVEYGITALEGSVISGTGIKFVVENDSDITEVDLSGATVASVQLKQELTITHEQFEEIGAAAFSVYRSAFGATEDLHIVVTSDVTLSDLVNLAELSSAVRLNFEIRNGATLTLSAEELHKYVQWHGIDSTDGLNGKVVITDAGYSFDAFDNGPNNQVIDGGSLSDSFSASGDVTILRNADGFNRPSEASSTDTTTIDSSVTPVVTDPVIVDGGNPTTLQIVGTEDIVFESYIDLGDGSAMGNAIDFSELDGTVTGMTVKNFDNIASVAGNNTGTRIDVEMSGDVGTDEQGLVSSGVETYVVTAIVDNDDNDGDADTDTATFYFCDETQDVEVVGLKGNADKTLTIANVPWGLVAPSILLEGDGYADWNGGLKADGNPDASDIGTVVVEYFTAGAPAVVNINNAGVELGVTSTGAERGFAVAGIELENAVSLSLNVTEGDAVIDHIAGSIETLTIDATEDVSIGGVLPSTLTVIDASAVDGMFSALVSPDGDFVFTGAAGGSNLAIDDFTATEDTSIDGGAAGVVLTIIGDVDLEEATLANVEAVVLTNGSSLNLTMAQADAIGAANFSVEEGGAAALNLSGLDGEPFALANYADGITVDVVSIAALPVVTLHATTDLTGITSLEVPEGTVLNLTAAQFQQLTGAGSITGAGSVNITDLTQADVEGGFDLSGVTATALTLTMVESVALVDTDDLGNFAVVMGDDMSLTLAEIEQADGLSITGGANSALIFTDTNAGAFESIDASGFAVTELHMLNLLVASRNVDLMFAGLSESVTKVVYTGQGWVDGVNQNVVIAEGTTITDFVVFNKPEGDVEIEHFTLDMMGGTEIDGNLRLSSSIKEDADGNDLIQTHLKTLTINSTGTAANLLNGETANVITGDITSQGTGFQGSYTSVDNNLLDVTINADQAMIVEGDIVFESVVADDTITANDDEEAVASLVVNGDSDVYIGGIHTDDEDVDGLDVVNNGSGILTVQINGDDIDQTINGDLNDDALSFTGSGDIHLIIDPTVDLSDDDLSAVTQIMIEDDGTLYLSHAQITAIGIANLLDDGSNTLDGAVLHIVDFGSDPFDATMLDPGIDLQTITMAAGSITLDPSTNLTGVDQIIVPEGGTLTMTAAQFQQLTGAGTITGVDADGNPSSDYTVNITDLMQADVDFDENGDGDLLDAGDSFIMTGITADNTTVSLGEAHVILGTFDEDGVLLAAADLDGAAVIMDDNQKLSLVNLDQADGLDISGGTNTTLEFLIESIGAFQTIDASGYDVDNLRLLNVFVADRDVEFLEDLSGDVTVYVFHSLTEMGYVRSTDRVVVIEESVTVPGFMVFNDWQDDSEVTNLELTMSGGTRIEGNLRLSTVDKDPALIANNFDTLTVISTGTAANVDTDETANVITGDITAEALFPPVEENNLLNVEIMGDQDFVVEGDIVFTSMETTDEAGTEATLTVSNTATTTVHALDVTDNDTATGDIEVLNVINTGGTLTITGGTPAITGDIEELILSGTGDMVFGSSDPLDLAEGVASATISVIDASGLSGDLAMGIVNNVDSADFTFTSGTGVTTMTLVDDNLDSTGVDTIAGNADDTAGWTFDFSNAAAGSEFHMGTGLTFVDGSVLNIDMGANGVLYIDATMDLSDLDLSIVQTMPIVLADNVTLTLTAAQADGLTIIAGDDTGAAGFDGVVNIVDLMNDTPTDNHVYDFSGISADVAGTVTLFEDDVTLDSLTDLGFFTVVLEDLNGDSSSLGGQTIRFQTVDQAERAIVITPDIGTVGDSSANVVWYFTSISAPVDTSDYDAALGRLWVTDDLINNEGGDVEQLFTTLPSTILRVDFADVTALNILLASNAIDRTVEFVNFTTVGDLTFNDMGVNPVEHIENLTLELGGQATIGDVMIDDVIGAPGYDPASVSFDSLYIESHRALADTHYLASETYYNDNDGTTEYVPAAGHNENVLPNDINTVGNIGVDAANNIDLLNVFIDTLGVSTEDDSSLGDGAQIDVGTITYDSEVAGSTALIDITGDNDITIIAVDTSDADITSLTLDATGFTATLDPVMHMDDTEEMTITNGNVAAGTIILSEVEGNELSSIDSSAFDGTLTMTLSQIDSNDDDTDADTIPDQDAFTFTSGAGVNTITVAATGADIPTLDAGSTWNFDFTQADTGSTLTLADTAVLAAGSNLNIDGGANDAVVMIDGDLDLSQVNLSIVNSLIIVGAGQELTLTVAQVNALSVDIVGSGTVHVIGDASNLTVDTGTHLRAVNLDFSGVTLIASPTVGFDTDDMVDLTNLHDDGAIDDNGDPAGYNITGSANADEINGSDLADTVTAAGGDDLLHSGYGDDTFVVTSGTDTIDAFYAHADTLGYTEEDVLVVEAGATADVTLWDPTVDVNSVAIVDQTAYFVATAETSNDGTATIHGSGTRDNTVDMSLATGANGFTIIGSSSSTTGTDTLAGSDQDDVINGGNSSQTAAAAADILTGNGGSDTFQFNVNMGNTTTLTVQTTQANVDSEAFQVTTADADDNDEVIQINYTINGAAFTTNVDLTATDMSATAVAGAIATALQTNGSFIASATSGGTDTVTAVASSGMDLEITGYSTVSGTFTTLAFDFALATEDAGDIAQVVELTAAGNPTDGDQYSALATLNGGVSIAGSMTASSDLSDDVVDEIGTDFNTNAGATTINVSDIDGDNLVVFTDENADNGGFSLATDTTAAFGGSGASNGTDYTTADIVSDFLSSVDKIEFHTDTDTDMQAGSGANYLEAAEVADYATALANAGTAFTTNAGTLQYYLTSATDLDGAGAGTDGSGLLFFDANLDGTADGVILLTGVTQSSFAAFDIIVS